MQCLKGRRLLDPDRIQQLGAGIAVLEGAGVDNEGHAAPGEFGSQVVARAVWPRRKPLASGRALKEDSTSRRAVPRACSRTRGSKLAFGQDRSPAAGPSVSGQAGKN